jgi:hypothetical protein
MAVTKITSYDAGYTTGSLSLFPQSIDSRYKYDALHAFGICTQYYTIMKGYPLQDEVSFFFV